MTKLTNCLLSKEASESYSSRSPELIFPEQKKDTTSLLRDAVDAHLGLEKASFHTPGHKGRALNHLDFKHDLTELPGLDDLSHPQGVLANLSKKASAIWNTQSSLISVNGASAGLVAAILSVGARGKKVLVPRNAHKAVVTGLVMSGLEPCWYSPEWNAEWCLFDEVSAATVEAHINQERSDFSANRKISKKTGNRKSSQPIANQELSELAAVVVVSPTYGGAMSDIQSIAKVCKLAGIALIVDEAHGAQLFEGTARHASAVDCGADIVVHSLHKTLGAMTQTGIVHLPFGSSVQEQDIAFQLNMMQSTSPSYPLLLSIEEALTHISRADSALITATVSSDLVAPDAAAGVAAATDAAATDAAAPDAAAPDAEATVAVNSESTDERVSSGLDAPMTPIRRITTLARFLRKEIIALDTFKIYDTACGTDSWHVLIQPAGTSSSNDLYNFLIKNGIYAECQMGAGVLLLLGIGTTREDLNLLLSALKAFKSSQVTNVISRGHSPNDLFTHFQSEKPSDIEQIVSPRVAAMAPSYSVPVSRAENLIASECIAPCPPGIPVCVPGQRLTKDVLNKITKEQVRVVDESLDAPARLYKTWPT